MFNINNLFIEEYPHKMKTEDLKYILRLGQKEVPTAVVRKNLKYYMGQLLTRIVFYGSVEDKKYGLPYIGNLIFPTASEYVKPFPSQTRMVLPDLDYLLNKLNNEVINDENIDIDINYFDQETNIEIWSKSKEVDAAFEEILEFFKAKDIVKDI